MFLTPWFCGLDLGTQQDYTALAIVQRQVVTFGDTNRQVYQIRHLERFPLGTSYPALVQAVGKRLKALPIPDGWDRSGEDVPAVPHYKLILDATGVGRPVADMFRVLAFAPVLVTITGGQQVHNPERDEFTVPKTVLISALQVVLQTQRIKVARGLPEAETLIKEALGFQFKPPKTTADDEYIQWREQANDDLLFAVSIGTWYAERFAPLPPLHQQQEYAEACGNPLLRPPQSAVKR